jgi:LacI family transcriptional regulator, gluconate utilization system Gnt-I transcriptional repressor
MKRSTDRSRRVTMADVAARVGVSKMTVSRALARAPDAVRGTPDSAKLRQKILAACEELGYVIDRTAGAFGTGRSGFIAVVLPTLNNSNFSETVAGLSEALDGSGLQLLLGTSQYRAATEEHLLRAMLSRRPEGVVLTTGSHTPRSRAMLHAAGVPVIETWELPRNPVGHVVGFSNAAASALVARHLHAQGRRRIAFVGGTSALDPRGMDRRRGYERAIRALGLAEGLVIDCGLPPISMAQGSRGFSELLQRWPDVDAVMCVSDPCAFGALSEAQRRGIRVPRQLAIAGFGNFEVGRGCVPSLTTVAVDCAAIGRTAGELMQRAVAQARSGTPLAPQKVVVPFDLVVRAST